MKRLADSACSNTLLIDLTLGGALVEYLPASGDASNKGNQTRLEIDEGSSVADVLGTLGLPQDARMMVIVDGNVIPPDDFVTTSFQPGSKLSVIPPIQAG